MTICKIVSVASCKEKVDFDLDYCKLCWCNLCTIEKQLMAYGFKCAKA